ncbi:MAG: peptidylprolyl isomerase, partial [Dehalococcoidales bacterium]
LLAITAFVELSIISNPYPFINFPPKYQVKDALESLTVDEEGEAGWYTHDILADKKGFPVVADYAFGAGLGLSGPIYDDGRAKDVGYWVVKLEDTDEDEQGKLYNVQVMLLGSEQDAQDVIGRLESGADGDFAEIAAELSQDTASKEEGGDLGWLDEEDIAEPLRDFILAAESGEISGPIRDDEVVTDGGYWLVDVLGIEKNRPIPDSDRDFLKRRALDEWISSLWDDPENTVESYLDEEKTAWAIDKAMGG